MQNEDVEEKSAASHKNNKMYRDFTRVVYKRVWKPLRVWVHGITTAGALKLKFHYKRFLYFTMHQEPVIWEKIFVFPQTHIPSGKQRERWEWIISRDNKKCHFCFSLQIFSLFYFLIGVLHQVYTYPIKKSH